VDPNTELFIKARDYLVEKIEPMLDACLCGIWDPAIEITVIKELNSMVNRDLALEFPDLSDYMRPKYLCRTVKEEGEIELSIQQYLNCEKGLSFLGNCEEMGIYYDLYCAPSWDGVDNYLFYARYGHLMENVMTGLSSARSEYYSGIMSPLAVAYGMAVHDGYVYH